jgi:hypothetical protein
MRKISSRKAKQIAKKSAKLSLMPLLAVGAILASMHGAFITGAQRQNINMTDFGYRVVNEAHTPDDLPLTPNHYIIADTKHLRHIRYDDGKEDANTKHFDSITHARGS